MSVISIFVFCIFVSLVWLLCARNSIKTLVVMLTIGSGIGFVLSLFGLLTQFSLLILHLLAMLVLGVWYRKKIQDSVQRVALPRRFVFITVVASFAIVAYQLYAVHFAYTGSVATSTGEVVVQQSAYPYPLYSDEWIAVAMVDTMRTEHTTPFVHPFTHKPYTNFLFVFHSLIAYITTIVGGSVAVGYVWIGIGINVILIGVLYRWWRACSVARGVALGGVLLAPYIVNSANLPMFWYLLPWNIGFILFVCGFVAMQRQETRLAFGALLMTVVMYPPYLVFVLPAVLLYIPKITIQAYHTAVLRVSAVIAGMLGMVLVLLVYIGNSSLSIVLKQFADILIRPLQSSAGIPPTFLLWQVIPLVVIPFAIYAGWVYRKTQMMLLVLIGLGLVWWTINGRFDVTVLIDYHRVVTITSIFIFMLGICGFNIFWKELSDTFPKIRTRVSTYVLYVGLMVFFIALIPTYTARETWRAFATVIDNGDGTVSVHAPASPVNRYVHPDDIRIFSSFSGERFLAPGWKGLILGTLTDNEPLFTKASTITVQTVLYPVFMNASCEEKETIMKKNNITYVYAPLIACPQFESIDVSAEGLHLMRVAS